MTSTPQKDTAVQLDQLYTIQEAAEYLGLSTSALNQWRSQKKGPPFCKLGQMVRYRKTDLYEYVRSNIHAGTTGTGKMVY